MRKIVAQSWPIPRYDSPAAAIREAVRVDRRERSVSDLEVKDKRIHQILWSDSILVLELDNHRFLNLVALSGRITCALETKAALTSNASDDVVLLELDGSSSEWRRAEIANKYVGKILTRLWFGDGCVYVYASQMPILACYPLVIWPEKTPVILWIESD